MRCGFTFSTRPRALSSRRLASRPQPDLPISLFRPALRVTFRPGSLSSPLGRAGHVRDLQVLDADHVKTARHVRRNLLHPVVAAVRLPGPELRDGDLGLAASVRAAPGPGELALQPQQPGPSVVRRPGHVQQLARGQGGRHGDAPVDADDLAVARYGDRCGDHGECDMPAPGAVPGDAEGLRLDRDGARPAEADPAGLRDPDLAPVAVQAADIPGTMLTSACLIRNPSSRSAFRHVGRRWVPPKKFAIACAWSLHRLLLDSHAALGQPRVAGPGLGQLPAAFREAWHPASIWPPPRLLLDAEVPDVPGVRAVPEQDCFLLGRAPDDTATW